jgi:cell division protein FtsB
MKESAHKTLVLAVSIIICFMLFAACEEEEKLSGTKLDTKQDTELDTKQSRLVAIENAQLKKQIEKLKSLHAGEMEKQKKLLDKCLREKGTLEEMSKEGVDNYMQNVLVPVIDENAKMKEEIETLKAQIAKLKTELEEAKK